MIRRGRHERTLLTAAALLLVTTATAEPAPTTVAMLVPQDQADEFHGAVEALRSQLVDLPVDLRVETVERIATELPSQVAAAREVARGTGAAIVFWCELEPQARVAFYVVDAGEGQPVVRDVEGSEPSARLETLALIVRGSVRAALSGHGAAGEAPPADASADGDLETEIEIPLPGAPPSNAGERGSLDLELAYAYEAFSTEDPATHGIGFGLVLGLHERWALLAEYRHVFTAITGETRNVSTRVRRHPVSLGARFRWPMGRFTIGVDVSATLDYVSRETWAPSLKVNPDQSDFVFSVSPLLRASVLLVRRLRLFLSAGAEIFFNDRRYGVLGETRREVLLDPWPVRPRLQLGVAAELF